MSTFQAGFFDMMACLNKVPSNEGPRHDFQVKLDLNEAGRERGYQPTDLAISEASLSRNSRANARSSTRISAPVCYYTTNDGEVGRTTRESSENRIK